MSFVLLNDNRSFAWQSSDAPTHVFLHGWARDSSDFEYFFNKVNGLFIDLPGFGKSLKPDKVWSPNDYAKWLKTIIPNSVNTIVAHSFGGRIATHFINNFQNIQQCILVGTPLSSRNLTGKRSNLKLKFLKKVNKLNLVSEPYLEMYRKKSGSLDYQNADGLMRDILVAAVNDDLSEIIKKISAPIVLIWGEEDTEVPLRVAQEIHGQLPNSRLFVLKNTGHNPFINNSDEVMKIIEKL